MPTFPIDALVICRQLQRRDGRLTVCPPKTAHSTRVLALDHTTIAALRAHRSKQQAEAAAYGDGYRDSGYVFTNLNGAPVAPGRLTHVFQKLIAEPDVPPIRLLSRSGARCRCCHRSVSPDRSPNPPYRSLGNGLSTVSAVRLGWERAMGWGSCSPGRCSG